MSGRRESIQATRKPRTCCECSWPIAVGERYQRDWDGDARTHVTCLACARVREEHLARLESEGYGEDGTAYGCLWDAIQETEQTGPEAELLRARVRYMGAHKWRERWIAMAEAAGVPEAAAGVYRQRAQESAEKYSTARDVLIAAGVSVPV